MDKILRDYFPDFSYEGVFLDIGAFEPIRISNSFHFLKNNWNVYQFEANTQLIPELQKYNKNVFNYAIYDVDLDNVMFNVVESNGWTAGFSAIELNADYKILFPCNNKKITQINVPQKTLNTILSTDLNNVKKIDIMSIDVEGGEFKVLQGIDLIKYSPKIIMIENIKNDIKIQKYLKNFGYILDKQFSYNQFYIFS